MSVALNEHAHQRRKRQRTRGGGDNQAELGRTKLSEQRHNPSTLQNSGICVSHSCIRIEHFQGFVSERSCELTHLSDSGQNKKQHRPFADTA